MNHYDLLFAATSLQAGPIDAMAGLGRWAMQRSTGSCTFSDAKRAAAPPPIPIPELH